MPKSVQCMNIDRVTLMSNECVPLIREEAGSYRLLRGELGACLRCGINGMFPRAGLLAASSLDLQGSRAPGKSWPGSHPGSAKVVLR